MTSGRAVRAVTVLSLALGGSATGAVAFAAPALAATPPPVLTSSPTPAVDRDPTPTWSFETPATAYECAFGPASDPAPGYATCTSPYTAPALATDGSADGTYRFQVREAGTGDALPATSDYTLDTVAPLPATLTTPPSPSTDRAPTWSVASAEPGVTAACQVLDPSGVATAPFAPCAVSTAGSSYQLDLTAAQDGAWSLVVRLTDAAGNTASEATGKYLLDTTAPRAVLVTGPVTPGSSTTPAWRLVGDSDAVLQCRLSGAGLSGGFLPCAATAGVPGSGSFTADLTASPDGSYSLTVRSQDAAGNLGPETTSSYLLDRVGPATPAPPVAPPSPARTALISWAFGVETGAGGLCTLSSATAVVAAEQPCSSPWTTDLSAFGDGDYALTLRAVDPAGNTSAAVSAHYVLDRTPPAPPSITSSPGSPNPDRTPSWQLARSDSQDRLECQLLGTPSPAWTGCLALTTYDLGTATRGTFRLQVRETDVAGNTSTVVTAPDYVLRPGALPPPDLLAPRPARSNNTQPVFTITRQAGDTTTVSLSCTVTRFDRVVVGPAPCDYGPHPVDLTGLHGDGSVVLSVRGLDARGKASGAALATYLFDDVSPQTPQLLGPDPSASFSPAVAWTFGGVPDADHYRCSLRRTDDTGPVVATTCTSPQAFTLPATGVYSFSVWSVDAAGNQSAAAASGTYTWLPPVPTPAAPSGPGSGTDTSPTWTFTVPVGYTAQCLLGLPGGQALTYSCSNGLTRAGSFTADLTGDPAGTYALSVRLVDAYGHVGAFSPQADYRYTPATATDGHLGQPAPGSASGPVPGSSGSRPPGRGGPATPAAPTGGGAPSTATRGTSRAPAPDLVPPVVRKPTSAAKAPGALPTLVRQPFGSLAEVPKAIRDTLAESIKKPTVPLLLLFVVAGFLLLQSQIDRRDPKLASAPVGAEPELDFGPVVGPGPQGRRALGGGAPA